jgi:hypothetical protein
MRTIICSALLALAVGVNASWAQDSSQAASATGAQPHGDSAAATSQAAGQENPQGETWRYRKHQGLWWYWLPSNKWVYWTDGHWAPYEAENYAEFNASRRLRAYSNSGGGYQSGDSWGNWGPIRYNQWGQRQYPYSQRSSGLQQLGPVPTPGGVRSLPGWGGER